MDLSIIILNYQQKGLVKQCLGGILRSNVKLDYEIIVVDNNSGDGCSEMVAENFPQVSTLQTGKNLGFAAGNNLGIRQAQGKYVMILNPDIAIVSGAVEKMYEFMESQSAIGTVSPKLINPDGTIQYSCRRFPRWLVPIFRRTILGNLPPAKRAVENYLMKDQAHNVNFAVDWLFGACLFIRKSALDQVGLFDERFFMYFEDLDLCRRLWAAGFEVWYLAEVELIHYHQRLSAESSGFLALFSQAARIHIASGIKYFAKYLGVKLPR